MSENTQDLLFSFVPLGGWVASLSADAFWQQLGMLNLMFALIIMMMAFNGLIQEWRSEEDEA
jgi:uncharacterized membrane protein